MSRILLTGKDGQLGWALQRCLAGRGELIATDSQTLDLSDADAIRRMVRDLRPDIIVNPAAYTAVDKAESEPALALAVNGAAPGVLAEEARRLGAALVHYSTDYVFDGAKSSAYTEDDTPNPQSVYGSTKLAGETAVRAAGGKHLILRTSWIYGVHGGNFVKTVLRLAKERSELRIVADQFGAPTWARDLAQATAAILDRWQQKDFNESLAGLYHLSATGRTSWHAYAEEIVRLARGHDAALAAKDIRIHPIATHEYPVAAKRPANSVLDSGKVKDAFGIELPAWRDSLAECISLLYETA